MDTVYLIRLKVFRLCTIGIIIARGNRYYSLELPWRQNKRNRSCIPSGSYECHHLARSSSGKYQNVYHLRNVKGRSGILIHNGNLPSHTKGCILLGMREGFLGGMKAVLNSKSAMSDFVRIMNKEPFTLRVI